MYKDVKIKTMRDIKFIILHCTAGNAQQKTEDIKSYWKRVLGWKSYGYHKLVNADGSVETLADDSDFTNIQGKITTETNYTAGAIVPTGYLTLYDATGTAYKIPAVL